MITKQQIKDALKKWSWIVGIILLALLVWGVIAFNNRSQATAPANVTSVEEGKATPATPPTTGEKKVPDITIEVVPGKPEKEREIRQAKPVEDVSIELLGEPGSGFRKGGSREKAQIYSFSKAADPQLGEILIPNVREMRGISVGKGSMPEFEFHGDTKDQAAGFKPIAHPSRSDSTGRAYVVFIRN